VKPWGTGHAVLCCREFLDAPFLVINADDYYGAGAFKLAYEYLRTLRGKRGEYFMVGYALKNTLTENGYVSRGVCTVNLPGRKSPPAAYPIAGRRSLLPSQPARANRPSP